MRLYLDLTRPPAWQQDRRVVIDRRSDESTKRWLDGIDKRQNGQRFGRRGTDMADEHYSPTDAQREDDDACERADAYNKSQREAA